MVQLNEEVNDELFDNLFHLDNGHSFESVLLYGIELTLATFELLTFIMVDLIYRNYILSAVITFFISKVSFPTFLDLTFTLLLQTDPYGDLH